MYSLGTLLNFHRLKDYYVMSNISWSIVLCTFKTVRSTFFHRISWKVINFSIVLYLQFLTSTFHQNCILLFWNVGKTVNQSFLFTALSSLKPFSVENCFKFTFAFGKLRQVSERELKKNILCKENVTLQGTECDLLADCLFINQQALIHTALKLNSTILVIISTEQTACHCWKLSCVLWSS
jgi:hypothetical protein